VLIDLSKKRVIVTGASRGVGLAIAKAFAADGARVAVCARGADAIQAAGEELAKNAGVDPTGLAKTLEKYNEDIESEGYDTVFGRKTLASIHGEPMVLDKPPYYAVKCTASITSFKGGIKINSKCQPVNNYGEAIPGLYAVGEVTGGLFGKGTYLGGIMWPASMTFGRLAGRSAAFETPWE